MHRSTMRRPLVGLLVTLSLVLAGFAASSFAHADNVTVSGNVARTGWDPNEPGLAPAQVSAADFGQQFSVQLDGSIYAQPLVIGNTVVVTTEKAKVYGISAATGAILWQRSFGAPFQSSTIGCADLTPDLGSTSTPVYDAASDTIYLTTKIDDGADAQHPHWYLQAIGATDGAEKPGFPITLQGTADNDPSVTFSPYLSMQRAGLLYANGKVYIGFGSHCDIGNWKGWVMAVNVTGPPAIQSSWVAEGGGNAGAGVWAAGGGLVTDGNDANGNPRLFVATGNGLSPTVGPGSNPPQYLGDSVVRIGLDASGHLGARDFFAPSNAPTLDQNDTDLGSGGPVALPDTFGTSSHPHLLVEDGKDGRVFLLDRDNLGGRSQGAGGTDATVQTVGPFNGVWGHPAVYAAEGGWVYYVENGGPLRSYARSVTGDGNPALTPSGASSANFGYTSGSPIVTSNGTTAGSALVWVVYSSGPTGANAQLRAYDAVPTNGVLNLRWSSSIGNASKFEMPATTGNRVFVGNRSGVLSAYGRPAAVALTGQPVDVGQVAVGGRADTTAHLVASRPITVTGASTTAPFGTSAAGLPKTLQPGDSIDVPVSYLPTAPGAASATLTLTTDLGPVTLDLHGVGTKPGLGASPAAIDFGTVATSQSKTLAVNISNTGTTDETIGAAALPSAPFSASGVPPSGTVLAPQQSIAVPVSYVPTTAGSQTGTLSIASTHGTLSVPLTGTAETGQGHLAFNPPSLDFGSVVVGTSRTLSFDIENTGNIPITVTKAKAPGGVFSSASPVAEGITIGPDDVVHQQVTFSPTAAGAQTASYSVTADDGQGALLETVSGAGVSGTTLPGPTTAGWTRNGSATVTGSDLVLTPAAADQAGSAFSTTVVPSNGLDARFTAQISGGSGADGMAFVLADSATPATALGAGGGGLGFGGLVNSVAVTLDTYQNGSDPSANFVGIATGTLGANDQLNYAATSSNVGGLTAGTHDVDVNVYGGHIRVSVDGDLKIDQAIALPASVRPGFSGGTGGLTDQHLVRNVQITTPSAVEASLAATPSAVALPTAVVGGAATTASVAFSNLGAQPVTLTGVTAPTAPFSATGLPAVGSTIAAGATVTIGLKYTPTATTGTNTSTVALTTAGGTVSVRLSGVTAAPGGTTLPPVTGTGWTTNGSAAVSGSDLVLTPAQAGLAGSVVSNAALPSEGLSAHFTAVLDPGGADGMTYTLLDPAAPTTSLGATGGGLGFGGLSSAVAVTLDTYQNGGDPAGNFVGIATGVDATPDALHYIATNTTVPQLSPGVHDVVVTYTGGHLKVSLDGTQVLDTAVTLPTYVRPAFTAGTGGIVDRHAVRNVTISAPAAVSPVAIDKSMSVDGRGTISTPALTTAGAGETLVAMVGYDGAATPGQTATVSGAGLTWTLAKRANAQAGTAEVWTARATNALTGATFSATTPGNYYGSLTVTAVRNAKGVGAVAAASALTGAPTVKLTTTAAGSLVLASGTDWDGATARTPATGQSVLHQYLAPIGDTFWAQGTTAPVAGAGTTVTIADTAPTNHRYNLAAVEILGGTPAADTTAPTVAVTAPTPGQTVAKTVTLTATASDNVGVTGVQFFVDGTAVGAVDQTAPYSATLDTTMLTNGAHAITARATDSSGNVGTSAAVSVTVANSVPDTTAPTVSVSAPAAGATVGGLLNVAATASDAVGVTSVQFYLDGNVLGAPMTATPYQLAWDTTSVPNGSHVLTARASDAAGNVGTSAPVTVTVANAPPSGLATDLTVSKDGTGNQTTAAFTTAGSGDLLLAFVSADGPAVASGQQATVSGAGLTWTRIKRANLRYGTSEVWQARATGVLTNATVTSALASSGYQSLTVVALRGAVGVGASIGASSVTGAPSVSVTTTAASSWLFAVGNDWDGAVARTLPAGQTMVHQVLPSVGDTLWVQTAHPNLGAGVATSIGATAPTNHQWNLVAVEVKPAP